MAKIKVCGPAGLQKATMIRAWKEAKEKESKGIYVNLGELQKKHRQEIKRELDKAKACIEVEV